ncbi:MAG: DNA polymerase III subunit alpha [Bacteroidetes bacterium]|nr:MAG: DNA polymerase III subunit alpha [Bacteroidota bacterium]
MFLHSSFSLRYGVLNAPELLSLAQTFSFPKVALCDINSSSAALSFIRKAQTLNFPVALGVDFHNEGKRCYVILAENNEGFEQINHFLSKHLHQKTDFPPIAPFLAHCQVIYPLDAAPAELREHEWLGIRSDELHQFRFLNSQLPREKLLAFQFMSFRNKRDFNTHRLLRAIDNNILLSQLTPEQQSQEDEFFRSYADWLKLFSEHPYLTQQLQQLINSCSVQFSFGEQSVSQNKQSFTHSVEEDLLFLHELIRQEAPRRYPQLTPSIQERIDKEIQVIHQKSYLSYFLIAWDIVSYARRQGFYYVGRGSGANSIIAYILGITDVDPLELDLYFERFINLYRRNPPDFDIDFSWKERDQVIQYIFKRYPTAALLCTYSTFQYRAAVREIGKVFGMPKNEIDLLGKGDVSEEKLDELSRLVIRYARQINGLPSHLSIHAGGIIISERPTQWFSATFLPPKGLPTTQFSMLEAEDVGLYKFDILSQRGLSKIHDCLEMLQEKGQRIALDIHNIHALKQDEQIKFLLKNALAIGCFYVESPAMRMLLTKLRVDDYLGLVAASSIIRPGVARSGMMREYILRHRQVDRRKQAHPTLQEIMPDTYGIMVYQEDVIKVAHHFAKLSLAEADVLRRGMSGKFRSRAEFQQVRKTFFDNCYQQKFAPQLIQDVWHQIESFAGYAFSKGHSASYAVESYQSLYLKAHFPLEYMTATINNFGGFYRTEVYVREAQRLGAEIVPPSINQGAYLSRLEGTKLFLGFNLVQGIEQKVMELIFLERDQNGPFSQFEDLIRRVEIPLEQLSIIIRIGALRDLESNRKALLWKAHFYHRAPRETNTLQLFQQASPYFELPLLEEFPEEEAFEQLELLGFPICNPFELLQNPLPEHVSSEQFFDFEHQAICTYGYLIAFKRSETNAGATMCFGTFYDQSGAIIDSVHFPDSIRKYPINGKGIYRLEGLISIEFEHPSIEVHVLEKLPYKEDVRFSDKLDFQRNINSS